jgi:hypothetical protein
MFGRPSLRDLDERLLKQERELASLKLEWETVQDKITKRMRAMRQAAEYLQKRDEEAVTPAPPGADAPTQGFLTPRQRAIQQQILHRRGGNSS